MVDVIRRYKEIFGCYSRPTVAERGMLTSSICRPGDLDAFPNWKELKDVNTGEYVRKRKTWEFLYICQALYERGKLEPGQKGLGFAVGNEPLSSIFANCRCSITATDAPPEMSKAWAETSQYAGSLENVFQQHIIDKNLFDARVDFQFADMKNIPRSLTGYDFIWSSCALEHLGSLHAAKDFIYHAMDCLKPGGIAVHTTEFNLKSSIETSMMGPVSILRSIDFIEISEHLEWQGHTIEPLDFRLDNSDNYLTNHDKADLPHFSFKYGRWLVTSFGLIIKKANKE